MRDFEALYHDMEPEDVEVHIAQLESKVNVEPQEGRSAPEIDLLFEYMQGLKKLDRHEEASAVFGSLRGIIDDFRKREEGSILGHEYFFEWSMLALSLVTESRSSFVTMHLYRELLETFDNGPETLRYRGVQSRGQLLRHVEYWLGKGGDMEVLEDDDREFIQAARDEYEALSEAAIDDCVDREDYVAVVRLYRNAAQYYLLLKKANEAIVALKEAIEYLPDTPDYHEVDKADMLLQIGQIFLGYGKNEIAIRYFSQAIEIYEKEGEEFEMQVYQAEGWIEEAKKRVGK